MSSRNKKTGDFNAIGRGANQPLFRFFLSLLWKFHWHFLLDFLIQRNQRSNISSYRYVVTMCSSHPADTQRQHLESGTSRGTKHEWSQSQKKYEDQVPSGGGYDFPRLKHYLWGKSIFAISSQRTLTSNKVVVVTLERCKCMIKNPNLFLHV